MPTIDLIHNGQIQPSKVTIEGPEPTYVPTATADIHLGWHSVNYNNGSGLVKSGDVYTGKPLPPGTYNIRFIGQGGFPKHEVEVTYRQVIPTPTARWNGTISDNGSVAANVSDMKSLGFDTIRVWVSWNPETGAINNATVLDTVNAYVAAGMNAIICFTPSTNAATVAYPTAGVASIIAKLDKRVIVGIINEPNLSTYWPQGNWNAAFAMASQISATLKAAGFKTASPCFTYQHSPTVAQWWSEIKAEGWTNFDYVDFHNYPTLGTVADKVAEFETLVTTYKAIALSIGAKTMCSEWGMYGDKSKFAEAFPLLDAIVKKHTDASAYFIMRETTAHSKYGLHLIDAAGNKTALGTAAAAVASQPVAKKN